VRPRGRRPAGSDTRGDILLAARRTFAERGYDATSLRGVARTADVDPALVHHYFTSKSDLFFHAVIGDIEADSEERIRPAEIIEGIITGPAEFMAHRWTVAFLGIWDRPGASDRLLSMLGAVAAGDEVRAQVVQFLQGEVFAPIAAAVSPDRRETRAQLAASHVMGIIIARYVARLPVLAAMPAEEVARLTAPNLQHYLTGDLGSER